MQSQDPRHPITASPESPSQVIEAPAATALLAQIRHIAQQRFDHAHGSHDWQHTLRVHGLCRRIGPLEGADMLTLEAAAFLHDIGRAVQDRANGSVCHAVQGAQMTEEILAPLPLDQARKKNIIHCVRTHRFRGDRLPVTIEAQVLFDADKLDAIGAVGIARAYLFAGELGACLHNPHMPPEQAAPYSRDDTGHREFAVKLSKIKTRIITAQGRRLAQGRHAFMETFFERFLSEYQGGC
jgi:uncharacterized protein